MTVAAWAALIPMTKLGAILMVGMCYEARKKRREKEQQADGKAANDHSHA